MDNLPLWWKLVALYVFTCGMLTTLAGVEWVVRWFEARAERRQLRERLEIMLIDTREDQR